MSRYIAQQLIRECVADSLKSLTQRARLMQIINEEYQNVLYEDTESDITKRRSVMQALKDPKFNNAQLAYALYHPKDQGEKDTVRSLFSKKAKGTADSDGTVRSFDDNEINKLYQLIRKR